jgi:pullulanase/glycogen debranching enzyme
VARLGFTLLATAQGISFINGGCEFGRSKPYPQRRADVTPANSGGLFYVYNSHDSSDDVNGFDWTLLAPGAEGEKLFTHVKGLQALLGSSSAFHLGSKALADSNVTLLDGTRPNAVAQRARDAAGTTSFSVFVNAGTTPVALATGADLTEAAGVVDSDEAGTTPVAARSGFSALGATSVTLEPRTAVVFRSAP